MNQAQELTLDRSVLLPHTDSCTRVRNRDTLALFSESNDGERNIPETIAVVTPSNRHIQFARPKWDRLYGRAAEIGKLTNVFGCGG